jgi:hypothetical protein
MVAIARKPEVRVCNVVGLDLGKLSDPSALALLQWTLPAPPPGCRFRLPNGPAPKRPEYNVPTLKRWPLGTPYRDILAGVIRFLQSPPLVNSPHSLIFDATGVGEAVYEMAFERFKAAGLRGGMCGVQITAGNAVTLAGEGRWHVAKKQLVSVLQVLLGNGRLHVAPELPEAAVLVRELGTFTVKISEAANESFEAWREKDHDDLVLAVALAAWAAERGLFWAGPG